MRLPLDLLNVVEPAEQPAGTFLWKSTTYESPPLLVFADGEDLFCARLTSEGEERFRYSCERLSRGHGPYIRTPTPRIVLPDGLDCMVNSRPSRGDAVVIGNKCGLAIGQGYGCLIVTLEGKIIPAEGDSIAAFSKWPLVLDVEDGDPIVLLERN